MTRQTKTVWMHLQKNNTNIVQYKYCYYLREKEFDYDI